MTLDEFWDEISDLSDGITIEERISLNDMVGFLKGAEQRLMAWAADDPDAGPLARILPDDLPIGDALGMDYFEYVPATDESASEFYFGISWANPEWVVFEDFLTINGFYLQFIIIGNAVSVLIEGGAILDDFDVALSVELPSLLIDAKLSNVDGDTNPSPLALLQRFGSAPESSASSTGLQLQDLSIAASPPARSLNLHLALSNLVIGPVTMAGEMALNYSAGDISGMFWSTFDIELNNKSYLIALRAEHPGPGAGWQFEGGIAFGDGEQKLTALFDYFATTFSIPDTGDLGFDTDVFLSYLYVSIDTDTQQYSFTADFQMTDPVTAEVKLTIELAKQENGYDKTLSGELKLGTKGSERIFDLILNERPAPAATGGTPAPSSKQLIALYNKPGGEEVPIRQLLAAVSPSVATDFPDLTFRIQNALLVLLKDSNGIKKYLFTSEMDFGFDLSGLGQLPLVGALLPQDEKLALQFQPFLSPGGGGGAQADKQLNNTDLKAIKRLLPDGSPPVPDTLGGNFELLTTVQMGSFRQEIALGMGSSDVQDDLGDSDGASMDAPTGTATAPAPIPAPAPSPAPSRPGRPPRNQATGATVSSGASDDQFKWLELGKSFGPLHLARLGLAFQNGEIAARLDGGLQLGPLQVELLGLGADYDLASHNIHFSLDGMGLNLKRGPLEIAGAFLRDDEQFMGKVLLKMETFSMGALGAYGKFNGHPSMFLYAFIDAPLGGPVFFFVEGLSFGFGLNRRLVTPPIAEMHKFPLVAEVIGSAAPAPGLDPDNPNFAEALRQEFSMLEKYIPPETGQYFLAAGLKFNSFKTLDCFALLVVNFGQNFDIAIMGVTRLGLPDSGDNPETPKVVVIELNFSIRFLPEEGILAAEAQLTPNSYILSSDCQLRGGFAFYTWFKGEHAGDFVLTIGGYNESYRPPSHYPAAGSVPRLSFNWRLSDIISIKGAAYYALTPKLMMLGLRMEAMLTLETAEVGVKAWFIAQADFLIYWKPFYYEAEASLELGADLVLHVLNNTKISMSASAELSLWGPEFTGIAHIKAKVLGLKVMFDISFGDTKPGQKPPITWDEFKTSFLPDSPEQSGLSINVDSGLVKTVKDGDDDRWIINGKDFAIQLNSVVPISKTAQLYNGPLVADNWLASAAASAVADITGLDTPKGVGVAPAHISADNFNSQPVIRLIHNGAVMDLSNWGNEFDLVPVYKAFPRALWDVPPTPGSKPVLSGEEMVQACGGYRLVGKKPARANLTNSFVVRNLEFDQTSRKLVPDSAVQPTFVDDHSTVNEAAQRRKRKVAFAALGFDVDNDHDMSPAHEDSMVYEPLLFRIS